MFKPMKWAIGGVVQELRELRTKAKQGEEIRTFGYIVKMATVGAVYEVRVEEADFKAARVGAPVEAVGRVTFYQDVPQFTARAVTYHPTTEPPNYQPMTWELSGIVADRRELKSSKDQAVFGWELQIATLGSTYKVRVPEDVYKQAGDGTGVKMRGAVSLYVNKPQFTATATEFFEPEADA